MVGYKVLGSFEDGWVVEPEDCWVVELEDIDLGVELGDN
jgi:hypothetical protein